jgi:agmatinase
MRSGLFFLALCSGFVDAHKREHGNSIQNPFIYGPGFIKETAPKEPTWLEKYGPQIDQTFSGPLSFSHLPYHRCLENEDVPFDIALLGMPFDTGVTYRSG